MTPQLPRIYTYKITFEEVPYYYYGWHKERKYGEYYMGSPVTHKWCWEFYTPKKQILELFEYSDEGCLKAQDVEKRIIKDFMKSDSRCLNANCGSIMSLKAKSKGGKRSHELGLGIHAITGKERVELGKRIHQQGLGIHALTTEERVEIGKRVGKIGGKIIGEKLAKDFTLVSPTGEVISGSNIRAFCREYNLNQANLSKVLNGQANSHKGYRRLELVPVPKVS